MLRIGAILLCSLLLLFCLLAVAASADKKQQHLNPMAHRQTIEKLIIPKTLYSSSFNRDPSYVPGGDEFYPFYGNNAMFGDDNLWSSALSRHLRFHMMRTPVERRAASSGGIIKE